MPRSTLVCVSSIAAVAILAGCGSSNSSSSSTAASSSASSSASAAPAASSVALITTKHEKVGTVLAYGPKRLTVYLFEADHGTSSCTGTCAKVWPPVTGKPQAGHGADAAALGTVKRSDGTTQVTYRGHPLYRYIKDGDDHDAYGQGLKQFGAPWYVLAPSGKKIDKS